MTFPDPEIKFRNIRFHVLYPGFARAVEQMDFYTTKDTPPTIKIKRRGKGEKIYAVEVEEGDQFLRGRCNCPFYEHHQEAACKHVYIVALNVVRDYMKNHSVAQWPNAVRHTVKDGIEALMESDLFSQKYLESIKETLIKEGTIIHQVPDKDAPVQKPVLPTEQFEQFEQDVKDIVVKDTSQTALQVTKAFGGTVKDIPKNLVTTLHGKPYVTVQGLVYAATKMGLKSINTQPIEWSWQNDNKRSVFRCIVTFRDGRMFAAHGVAIPDGKNIQNDWMFAFVDHLAETRAKGRALRTALAFGQPTVEEMSEYQEDTE